MFNVTRDAAKAIRRSAREGDREELALRIAARRGEDGGIEYRMGFDEVGADDLLLSSNGVDVVIGKDDKPLLAGATLDYVELEPERFHYVFLNPNDPHYEPPTQ